MLTRRQALRYGYEVNRGSFIDTPDNRADRWYIELVDSCSVDRRGEGYRTVREALQQIEEWHEIDEEDCTCLDRSWYGPEHDSACSAKGPRK